MALIGTMAIIGIARAPTTLPDRGEAAQSPPESSAKTIKGAILEDFVPKPTEVQKSAFASIIGKNTDYLTDDEFRKLLKICLCESSLKEDAISFAGWKGGMGLCGFIPSTWNRVLKKINGIDLPERCYQKFIEFDKTHPIFSAECNWGFAMWLYKNEGEGHWYSSKECWQIKSQ